MASAAGIPQRVDPTLVYALRNQKSGKNKRNSNHIVNTVTLIMAGVLILQLLSEIQKLVKMNTCWLVFSWYLSPCLYLGWQEMKDQFIEHHLRAMPITFIA